MNHRPLTPDPNAPSLNLQDPDTAIQVFQKAAAANHKDPRRKGNSIFLPQQGRLTLTGDIHDNPRNYRAIIQLAKLATNPQHYLILHELIHGPNLINHCDMSIRILLKAAALKLQYPNQVLFIQANHELAQYNNQGILKNSINVIQAFDAGIDYIFHDQAQHVRQAMREFIISLPLAIRCANGILISHSLPSDRNIQNDFDTTILDRDATPQDYANGGAAHQLVWGRKQTQPTADLLAKKWNAHLFVMGHQKAEMGYQTQGSNMLILNSDHSHGVALPIDLSKNYTLQSLINHIKPLAAIQAHTQ